MCTLNLWHGRVGNLASGFTVDLISCPDGGSIGGTEVDCGCTKLLCFGGLVVHLGSGLARDGARLRIREENV